MLVYHREHSKHQHPGDLRVCHRQLLLLLQNTAGCLATKHDHFPWENTCVFTQPKKTEHECNLILDLCWDMGNLIFRSMDQEMHSYIGKLLILSRNFEPTHNLQQFFQIQILCMENSTNHGYNQQVRHILYSSINQEVASWLDGSIASCHGMSLEERQRCWKPHVRPHPHTQKNTTHIHTPVTLGWTKTLAGKQCLTLGFRI